MNDPLTKVDCHVEQTMRCVLCWPTKYVAGAHKTKKARKGIVLYNPSHGITSMKKHVDVVHASWLEKYKISKDQEGAASRSTL